MNPVQIPADALVMVGDGQKALFLRNRGTTAKPALETEEVLKQDNPQTSDQGTDRPGRRGTAVSSHVSAMEETDWHQLQEDRFAVQIAEALYKSAHAGDFKDLIIVAPPSTLGVLRKAFHTEVSSRIVAELPKTLTGHEVKDIERLILKAA